MIKMVVVLLRLLLLLKTPAVVPAVGSTFPASPSLVSSLETSGQGMTARTVQSLMEFLKFSKRKVKLESKSLTDEMQTGGKASQNSATIFCVSHFDIMVPYFTC